MVDIDEGLWRPTLADLQLVQIHLEGVRVNADDANAHGTIQRGSHRPCDDMTQQEGRADKTHEPEQRYDSTDDYTDPTYGSAHW